LQSRPPDQPIGNFREFIRETLENNKNLFNLLTRLLDSYSYESGRKSLNLTNQNIRTIVRQVLARLRQFADSKSMKIDINIEENLPDLKLDRDEIEKAFYYLVENAITYTQPSGQITIKSSRQGDNVYTCVSDNGPGIDPDIREKIFKRYEMAAALERKIGAGLSLYLTKQIVEAHKGKIHYEKELGKGTTFCLSLPIP
jgi:signal transduction histidine kinase